MAENKCAPSPFSPNPTNESSNNNHVRIIPIEIPDGKDIIEVLTNFAQACQAELIVFRGSGPISDITLVHPVTRAPNLPMEGPFQMISLTGTHINSNCDRVPPEFVTNPACLSFSICFSGGDGQMFGGIVGGKVHAAGVVWVEATLFNKLEFCTEMPMDETLQEIEEDDPINANGVINNVDHVAHESNNNNIVADMPDLDCSEDNSNQPN
jgi:hypothetical protein